MKKFILIFILALISISNNSFAKFDDYFDLEYITSYYLGICTLNNSTVFLCGMNGHVLVSYDKGINWKKCNINSPNSSFKSIYAKGNTAITVDGFGSIFYSNDYGNIWNKSNYHDTTNLSYVLLSDSLTGFIFGSSGIIIKTNDGGKNWENITSIIKDNIYAAVCTETKKIIISTSNGKIYSSSDEGNNWIELKTQLGSFVPYNFSYSFDHKIYLLTDQNIIKSSDDGLTWTVLPKPDSGYYYCCYTSGGKGYFTYSPSVGNGVKLIYSVNDTIIKERYSLDSSVNPPIVVQLLRIAFFDENNGIAAGTNDLIFRTTNGGISWELKSYLNSFLPNYTFNTYNFINDTLAYIGAHFGYIFKTTNSGTTWEKFFPRNTSYSQIDITQIYFFDENKWFYVADDGYFGRYLMHKTTDNGITFTIDSLIEFNVGGLIPYYKDNFILLSERNINNIFHTQIMIKNYEGGHSNLETFDSIQYMGMYNSLPNNLIICGSKMDSSLLPKLPYDYTRGIILRTKDTAKTWEKKFFKEVDQLVSIQFYNDSIGFTTGYRNIIDTIKMQVTSYKSYIYKTIDGGNNWTIFDSLIGPQIKNIKFFRNKFCFLFTSDSTLFSTDLGIHWEKCLDIYPYKISGFFNTDSCLFSLGSRGLFSPFIMKLKLKSNPTLVKENNSQIEIAPPLAYIYNPYPNPAENYVNFDIIWDIAYNINDLKYRIFDLMGDEITNPDLEFNTTSVNTATIKWNTDKIPKGIYFFQMEVNGSRYSRKMVVY